MKNFYLILALVILTFSLNAAATEYCSYELTNGDNSVKVSCVTTGENVYQIIIVGENLTGIGGSYVHINGTDTYALNSSITVSSDATTITCTFESSSATIDMYTPLYVMISGAEVSFTSLGSIDWLSSDSCDTGESSSTESTTETPTSQSSGNLAHFATTTTIRGTYDIVTDASGNVTFTLTSSDDSYTMDYGEVQILNVGNYSMAINDDGTATYTLENQTIGTGIYFRFLYSTTQFDGNEMTAENLSTTDTNIFYYEISTTSTNTAISEVENAVEIYAISCNIVIKNAENRTVTVYDLSGRCVYNETNVDNAQISLNHGIYIVRVGNATKKLSLR